MDRLQREGVPITMPLTTEERGERAFQVRDPNRVIVQLIDPARLTGAAPVGAEQNSPLTGETRR